MGRRFGALMPLLPLLLLFGVLLNLLGHCEMSVYPGLRRKPHQQQALAPYELPTDFLTQLMEENARRRLQQQFEQQLELIKMQMARQRQRQERERYDRHRQLQLQAAMLAAANEGDGSATGGSSSSSSAPVGNIDPGSQNNSDEENMDYDPMDIHTYSRYRQLPIPPPPPSPPRNALYDQFANFHGHGGFHNGGGLGMGMGMGLGGLAGSTREFSFRYPPQQQQLGGAGGGRPQFAVAPNDPRFYEGADNNIGEDIDNGDNNDDNNDGNGDGDDGLEGGRDIGIGRGSILDGDEGDDLELDSRALEDYEEYVPAENQKSIVFAQPGSPTGAPSSPDQVLTPVEGGAGNSKITDNTNFHRIKPQSAAAAAAAAAAGVKAPSSNVVVGPSGMLSPTSSGNNNNMRHDINALINKLHKEGKSDAIINGQFTAAEMAAAAAAAAANDGSMPQASYDDQNMVLRQHLGMDGEVGMYLVALIAGVSAAVTVGLIALAFTWMHNRSKAAADVEYPAYGVTGPNKDISPSGDRKLAQSAQMYHYQHQKQQIIAMENRQAAESGCGLSDVESDDDNEEGDYTVYECPGLAPTGEMEVKNPLFLDETPMTPGNAATTSGGTPSTAAPPPPAPTQAQVKPNTAGGDQSKQQAQPKQAPTQNSTGKKSSGETTNSNKNNTNNAATDEEGKSKKKGKK